MVGLAYYKLAEENPASSPFFVWLNIIATCLVACLVPCTATLLFHDWHIAPQKIPEGLEDTLEPPLTEEEFLRQNILIGVLSFLAAIPFAAIAYLYNFFDIFALALIYIFYVDVGNIFLHLLPVKLLLVDPWYNTIPRLFFEGFRYIMGYKLTQQEQALLAIKTQRDQNAARTIAILQDAKKPFLCRLARDLDTASQTLKTLNTSEQLLQEMLKCHETSQQHSKSAILAAQITGAIVVFMSCLGYMGIPYSAFRGFELNEWQTSLSIALPTVFFGILVSYFGKIQGARLLNDLSPSPKDSSTTKIPLISQLYPTSMRIFTIINLILFYPSGAAAEQTMRETFGKTLPSWAMIILYAFAHAGIGLLSWYTLHDYEKLMMGYWAQYVSNGAERDIMITREKFEKLFFDIRRLKPELAQELIDKLNHRIDSQPIFSTYDSVQTEEPSMIEKCFTCLYPKYRTDDNTMTENLFRNSRPSAF